MVPTPRTTARVLPVAGESCLLLLEQDPARPGHPYWGVIGGAVEPGEDLVDVAVRELWEETGLSVTPEELTPALHRRTAEFSWNGVAYSGHATVFGVGMDPGARVTFAHQEPEEVGNILAAEWVTPEQAAADGRLMWADLPDIMTQAITVVGGAK